MVFLAGGILRLKNKVVFRLFAVKLFDIDDSVANRLIEGFGMRILHPWNASFDSSYEQGVYISDLYRFIGD